MNYFLLRNTKGNIVRVYWGGQLSAEQACLRAKSYLFLKVTVLVFVVLPTHITDLTKTTDQAKLT